MYCSIPLSKLRCFTWNFGSWPVSPKDCDNHFFCKFISTVSKMSSWITKKVAKFGSSTHLAKIWRNLPKGAERKSREFCLHSYGVRGRAYHKNIQYCACHLLSEIRRPGSACPVFLYLCRPQKMPRHSKSKIRNPKFKIPRQNPKFGALGASQKELLHNDPKSSIFQNPKSSVLKIRFWIFRSLHHHRIQQQNGKTMCRFNVFSSSPKTFQKPTPQWDTIK